MKDKLYKPLAKKKRKKKTYAIAEFSFVREKGKSTVVMFPQNVLAKDFKVSVDIQADEKESLELFHVQVAIPVTLKKGKAK